MQPLQRVKTPEESVSVSIVSAKLHMLPVLDVICQCCSVISAQWQIEMAVNLSFTKRQLGMQKTSTDREV